ncbi:hypothetical protein cypCar_00015783 [Cyprinus carpio]|nr:hypothetical protein cypCar_00015783 [Cyprinus carpio]
MAEDAQEVPQIALEAVIGFNGHVFSGLKVHPDKEHIIYPLGCTVIIKSLRSGKQTFLHGHTNNVSCISVSKSGRYIASGQVTFMGFKADIIIWDYEKKEIYARLVLHKARVEDLSFSPNDKYLVSLGGQDDGRSVQLEGGVTSVTLRGDGQQFYVGTEAAQIYSLGYIDFKPELIATNHNSAVKDVAFPFGTSELFATCSQNDIRVWHTESSKELLRIMVPNITCNALGFMQDGRSIFSAWNDGKIRVFTPESGKLKLIIHNAHSMGVTAIAATNDCKRIVSGGGEGQVRVWEIFKDSYRLIEIMKEHKATVNCIKIKSNDKECVTASSDGACIIWDLVRFVRNQMVLSNTLFNVVCYHPEEFQIITSGTDRKTKENLEHGGDDKLLKLWHYSDGEVTHVGVGHSGSITNVRICPNSRCIVSTSADGAILRWRYPQTLNHE